MLIFSKIPENEKILRGIDRELNVKESLFLLLLQKEKKLLLIMPLSNRQ